jgi:hypothetical protein
MKRLEKKMMQKIVRSIIQAWLLSAAILISGAHYNVAHAAQDNPKKPNCGCLRQGNQKTVQRLAVGVPVGIPVQVNNVLGCFQKSQEKLSARCAAMAMNVVRMCDSDANRLCWGVVAGSQGNIVGCLTMARNLVSPQCNAALDAASLR